MQLKGFGFAYQDKFPRVKAALLPLHFGGYELDAGTEPRLVESRAN